jgi:hypothetical protein
VRYETTPRWDGDYKALKPEHKRQFREVLVAFIPACDAYAQAQGSYRWPKALRVSPMKSAAGVWEMTWSFASPDGRATFEWVTDEQGLKVRWRRIGDHSIYREP